MAQQIGYLLYISSNKYNVVLLDNNSTIPYITEDQPIINTYSDYTKINKHADNLEYYYPISPNIAILITNDLKYNDNLVKNIDEDEVMKYNQMIKASSQKFIFAKHKTDFEF